MSTTAATAIQTTKKKVVEGKNHVCCPPFDERKASFDEKEIQWTNKPFVKDSTWCFMYVPLNFGGAVKRACAKIDAADAAVPDEEFILLSDMKSPWITNIYFSVTKDVVPNAEMTHLSGTFLTKVFKGPFQHFEKVSDSFGRLRSTFGILVAQRHLRFLHRRASGATK